METYNRKRVLLLLSLDFKQAFDSVSHTAVLAVLAQQGLTGTPLTWFESFLKGRTFKVYIGNCASQEKTTSNGVPQGSVLSPTLFSILMSKAPIPEDRDTHVEFFADDAQLLIQADTIQQAEHKMQHLIQKFIMFAEECGLQINPTKSAVLCFTRKKIPNNPKIYIKGREVPYKTKHKILGIILNGPILTFKDHVSNLTLTCTKRLDVMKRIAGTKWGASASTLLKYYNIYIRSKIDYASTVYASASDTVLSQLNKIQNTAIRIALGAMLTSPLTAIHAEAKIMLLQYRRKFLTCKQYYKYLEAPENHTTAVFLDLTRTRVQEGHWNTPYLKPFQCRAQETITQLGLPALARNPCEHIPDIPPWQTYDLSICMSIPNIRNKNQMTPELVKSIFLAWENDKFQGNNKIYTDGSVFSEEGYAGAAAYIPQLELVQCWRLPPSSSITMCLTLGYLPSNLFLCHTTQHRHCNLHRQQSSLAIDHTESTN